MMTPSNWLFGAAFLGLLGMCRTAFAEELSLKKPTCEPGYTIVEEICYREVVKKVCRAVPDVQKIRKTVYAVKEEDFCVPKNPGLHLHGKKGCDELPCPECEHPRTRRILVKKEVVEEVHTVKCVVENVVELVPYKVYRKVPCADNPPLLPCPPPGK